MAPTCAEASCSLILCAALQADAPVTTGNGINWYGGPVLNNKAGIVVRHLIPAHKSLIISQLRGSTKYQHVSGLAFSHFFATLCRMPGVETFHAMVACSGVSRRPLTIAVRRITVCIAGALCMWHGYWRAKTLADMRGYCSGAEAEETDKTGAQLQG